MKRINVSFLSFIISINKKYCTYNSKYKRKREREREKNKLIQIGDISVIGKQ